MNYSPTLTAEDFKRVHNGKCKLHSVLQMLRPVVKDSLVGELERAIEEIDAGLAAAYAAEDAEFNRKVQLYKRIAHDNELTSVWSIFEVEDFTSDDEPFPAATHLRYDGGFGKAVELELQVQPANWMELWRTADEAIKQSGDSHHIFIESLNLVDGVVVLSCGS